MEKKELLDGTDCKNDETNRPTNRPTKQTKIEKQE